MQIFYNLFYLRFPHHPTMPHLNRHTKGMLIAAAGVLLLSPDSLMIRLIQLDLWTLAFLRGAFISLFTLLLLVGIQRGRSLRPLFRFDAPAWGVSLCMAVSTLAFVQAIQTTSVTHTLIILGATPILTAILAFLLLRETISRSTRITAVVVFFCLFLVVHDDKNSSLEGDAYAGVAALALSLSFVFARRTALPNRLPMIGIGGLMASLACLPWITPADLHIEPIALSALLGLFVGGAYALFLWAPRYITAAEAAVFLPLEAVFGSLLVWWFLHEEPGIRSILGSLGVVLAIMIHSGLKLRDARR